MDDNEDLLKRVLDDRGFQAAAMEHYLRPASRLLTLVVGALVLGGLAIGTMSIGGIAVYLPYGVVGALLAIRRPRTTTGWLLIGVGWAFVVGSMPAIVSPHAIQTGTAPGWQTFVTWIASAAGFFSLALIVVLMVTFPSGHLPPGRWRPVAAALIAVALGGAILPAFGPTITVDELGGSGTREIANPYGLTGLPAVSWLVVALPLVGALIVGAGSMVIRVRRARGLERQQLRWLVAALVAVSVAFAVTIGLTFAVGDRLSAIAYLPVLAAVVCVPIAIAFAVFRYRLYDIDTLINRTVLYAAVTILILGIFGVANIGLQRLAEAWLGGQSVLLAGFLGIAVGILYGSIRRAVRPVVDRFLPGRSLVALLFTDIVGSTEQLVALGDERWRVLLGRYRAAVRQELSRYSGTEVDTAGDAFFAIFERPALAVSCAIAIRSAAEQLGIQLRTGVHLGEVEMRGEKVSGIEVHAAARIMAAAEGGEILLSAAVRDAIAGAPFATIDRGRHQLKGLPDGWQLFALEPV